MLAYLGSWIDVSKTTATIKEFRFGTVRVARIRLTKTGVGTKQEGKMWEARVFLPGVGSDEILWGWTQDGVKREVETVLSDWLFESGIQELFSGAGAAIEAAFVMPDSVEVVEFLAPPPTSARIIPLEPHRRGGGRGLLPPKKIYVEADDADDATPPSKLPRKQSHGKRRSMMAGQ